MSRRRTLQGPALRTRRRLTALRVYVVTTRELTVTRYGALIHDHSLTPAGHALIAVALGLLYNIGENNDAGMTHDDPARLISTFYIRLAANK